ncbi:MAG TPA: pyruvate, water dikinase regulatory protein [Trueperaceae bacterium]|nr:pyruvate, water dikinase regulatory protein [Trueperaceae bacterium]
MDVSQAASRPRRHVFFVSDHTGVTAEVVGQSLLARFDHVDFETATRPFVSTAARAREVLEEFSRLPEPPIVFSTITDPEVRAIVERAAGVHFDLFEPYIARLEEAIGQPAVPVVGAAHSIRDLARYQARIDAVEFSLNTDDGSNVKRYANAEVIMVGVSRVGKSPTCLYLTMTYGVRASNFPLVEEDLETEALPKALAPFRDKLFGLTIDPRRLHELRTKRSPGTNYAALERCEFEVRRAERLFRRNNVPFLDTTNVSVEELASQVLLRANLERHR